jgi:hypothetical protein
VHDLRELVQCRVRQTVLEQDALECASPADVAHFDIGHIEWDGAALFRDLHDAVSGDEEELRLAI